MYSVPLPHAQPPPLPVMHPQQQQAPSGVSAATGAPIILPMPWGPSDAAAAPLCPLPQQQQQQQYPCLLPTPFPYPVVVGATASSGGGTGTLTLDSVASSTPHYMPYIQLPLSPSPPQPAVQPLFTPPTQSHVQYLVNQQQLIVPSVGFTPPQSAPTTSTAGALASMHTAGGLATGLSPQYIYLAPPQTASGASPVSMDSPSCSTPLNPAATTSTTAALPLLPATQLPLPDGKGWYSAASALSTGMNVVWCPSSVGGSSSSNVGNANAFHSTPLTVASAVPAPTPRGVVTKSLRHSTNGIGLEMGGTYQGVIKRYNHARGFGFIQSDQGVDIFFHSSGISSSSSADLDVGKRVEFRVLPDLDHVQAVQVRVMSSSSR